MEDIDDENMCKICEKDPSKYVCPKCNIPYCSLKCYQSAMHLECSEKFYENCIKEEIKSNAVDNHSEEDVLDIIKRVNEEVPSQVDSDDDEEVPDLLERLKNVDLNDANSIWDKLTNEEKQDFEALVSSSRIAECISAFEPWWEKNDKKIEEIGASQNETTDYPSIVDNIKPFDMLTKTKPAECVKYNLVNILAGYTFVVRYFNGDHFDYAEEAVYVLTTLSRNILYNENFEDYYKAVESVHQQSLQNDWVFASADTAETIQQDVQILLKNVRKTNRMCFVLSALSDIYNLLTVCKRQKVQSGTFSKRFMENVLPPDKIVSKRNIVKCLYKIEYYLSFVISYAKNTSLYTYACK